MATFALTETNANATHLTNSTKSPGVQNFLSMTYITLFIGHNLMDLYRMSDFFNPEITAKINKVAESLDLDPRSNQIRDLLWEKINSGRDYYNIIRDEVRKKKEQLKQLKERSELLDVMADNGELEQKLITLTEDIEKVKTDIEMAEMHTETLHDMISVRKRDIFLCKKRFTIIIEPYMQYGKLVDKNLDEIVSMDKLFQHFMVS